MKSLKSKLFQNNKLNALDKIVGGLDYTAATTDTNLGSGYDTANETLKRNGASTGIDINPTGGSTTLDKPNL
ncbi:MAG: hypothetical protein RIT10_1304 [Bacteroidota bacterium]|jgi:hypothetical protein